MLGWLIYSKPDAAYNKHYIAMHYEEGKKLGIAIQLLFIEDFDFGIKENTWFLTYEGAPIKRPDFVICRTIYPLFSKQLEYMNIPVFNNAKVAQICNDKARTYQYLAKTGIKMVDTTFYKNEYLKEKLEQAEPNTVIKAVNGHGGAQVFLTQSTEAVEKKNTAGQILAGIAKEDIVFQPLVGSRCQDVRVYVIGSNIMAAVCRSAKQGFRANFSLGGEVCLYQLKEAEKKIVEKIISQFAFGLVGIDFLVEDSGAFLFNEIEDVVGARMLYQCSNMNLVRLYLTFILEQI